MTGATPQVQSQRKTKVGRVVSDKMDKTIVVSVERLARHPLYKRVIRLTTKFKAHDEQKDAHVGETVSTADIVADEEATSEAIHAAAHPGRRAAEADDADEAGGSAESDAAAADVSAEEVEA